MNKDILFDTINLSDDLSLKNRIVMAPMTRSMATEELIPTNAMADYYGRRADVGLIVAEATIISPMAQGYPNTPGLYNEAQIEGWKKVTDKVHQNGGKIFAQLWHCGRVSHPYYLDGKQPVAPSAVILNGRVPRGNGLQYGMPREISETEIFEVIQEFAKAAENARKAGFDGVELHAANGYLLDQFLHWETNRRNDAWGGNPEKMARFLFDVIDAVQKEINHVAVRLSPVGHQHLELNEDDKIISDYVLQRLNQYNLTYVHTGSHNDIPFEYINGTVTQYIRSVYQGTVIACGGYSPESARDTLRRGDANLIAIGRPLIANPDYIEKVRANKPLTEYRVEMLNELV
ncbi:alkene reductase [Aliivibrio finisterrensis]|uniref:alkene reductase n=1 Tax=Aliivibrio finisterrensis TaxID=511998 RepID=UPI0010218DFA|nr:alkene reductase [Aliivibrio finisterrensis]RYU65744.1 alkene reductase [Aliivibrio finisterrensis]RYU69204.1 alkene reductase [Aliivibrio finisterrensis]RYU72625.1 alkene reductase [Aliivibrio finisterrensis]